MEVWRASKGRRLKVQCNQRQLHRGSLDPWQGRNEPSCILDCCCCCCCRNTSSKLHGTQLGPILCQASQGSGVKGTSLIGSPSSRI
ncbi:hypothetical protein E2C01_095880 [Portunus trituberculatus]|uniref:Uncharacterized protein n=1 Tax=Portunus trituberculatus TaxID=210409 RepID=A0A5B7JU69_PORTR|nr:hypothetical protein [Portunus trituberculatus]